MFQTEYEFSLPCGFLDADGTLHRNGVMRLATAADEILPLKDVRVQSNEAYLIVILLSRVVARLGSLPSINPKIVEGLFAADLAYLQALYNRINALHDDSAHCPHCGQALQVVGTSDGGLRAPGESRATPSIN